MLNLKFLKPLNRLRVTGLSNDGVISLSSESSSESSTEAPLFKHGFGVKGDSVPASDRPGRVDFIGVNGDGVASNKSDCDAKVSCPTEIFGVKGESVASDG